MKNIREVKDKKSKSDLASSLAAVREQLPQHMEMITIQAKLHRAKYKALVAEGFKESEALELCKDIFP